MKTFLATMEILGEKLGPLLFQFGYFNKSVFADLDDLLVRLLPFPKTLPKGNKFAIEIRNKNWLVPKFAEVLREHKVALALIDQSWMPRCVDWFSRFGPNTTEFTHASWPGDRKGIEEKTKTWDEVIVDRRGDLLEWIELLKQSPQTAHHDLGLCQQSLRGSCTGYGQTLFAAMGHSRLTPGNFGAALLVMHNTVGS